MGPDAMILVFWILSFKPIFSLSSFTFIRRLFSSSSLFAIRVVSSSCLRLLIFLRVILIPACASSSPAFLMMYSAYKLNKQGDNIQPWWKEYIKAVYCHPACHWLYNTYFSIFMWSQSWGGLSWHMHSQHTAAAMNHLPLQLAVQSTLLRCEQILSKDSSFGLHIECINIIFQCYLKWWSPTNQELVPACKSSHCFFHQKCLPIKKKLKSA